MQDELEKQVSTKQKLAEKAASTERNLKIWKEEKNLFKKVKNITLFY